MRNFICFLIILLSAISCSTGVQETYILETWYCDGGMKMVVGTEPHTNYSNFVAAFGRRCQDTLVCESYFIRKIDVREDTLGIYKK